MARVLDRDLEAAGIAKRDESDRVLDFQAFRHTFITNLRRGGVHPKTAQELARHSTIALTMDTYTHSVGDDQRRALDVLPDLSTPPDDEAAAATGTDGMELPVLSSGLSANAEQACSPVDFVEPNEAPEPVTLERCDANASPVATVASVDHDDACDDAEDGAPGRTRTCDPRIRNPMLYPAELRARRALG